MMHCHFGFAALFLLGEVAFGEFVPDFGPDFVPSNEPNMNGEYVISTTPGGTPGKFPKQFRDYPGGVEYFDVISPPMTTLYSQVWWAPLAPTSFPKEMVDKYRNKSVAIVGWEIDQVRFTSDGKEVSVPISATYNHHYNAQIIGEKARFQKTWLDGPSDPRTPELLKHSHGYIQYDQPVYLPKMLDQNADPNRSSHFVTSANGGEYRKSYHGFPPGYAVIIDSPSQLQISPMQIDTWNREKMNISGPLPPKFVPGPLPRSSLAPENAIYSGLLECPITTRISKAIDGAYELEINSPKACSSSTSGQPILSFQECYHAAATAIDESGSQGQVFVNSTGYNPNLPLGCSVSAESASEPLKIHVFFNKLSNSTVGCGEKPGVLAGAVAPQGLGTKIAVTLDSQKDTATITLTGPSDVWYGVGFGAQAMGDRPWTLIVEGSTGAVTERKLGGADPNTHVAGDLLTASVKVVANTVASGVRTVVVSRALAGAGPDYYTFDMDAKNPVMNLIAAVGSTPTLSYHKTKAPAQLALLPVGTPQSSAVPGACVCPEQPPPFSKATGRLVYTPTSQTVDTGSGSVGFPGGKTCQAFPYGVLIDQKNPTCDIRTYRGGQWSCHHKWSLLDADQEIPWADQPLVFHHKWRVWVQPYNETYHQPIHYGGDTALLLGSPWEYDVPVCKEGVAGCSLVNNGTQWIHTVTGNRMGKHHFVGLNFHCHAPTCLSMSVYACDKSVALEDCNTTNGKLLCEERPAYGGSGAPQLNGTRFDETGYIAIPDCFWGKAENGLEAPPDLTDVPLHMVKISNATWPHYGEMAGGQVWVY